MDTHNPIRRLRKYLRLSQVEFGALIGRAHQSVANYEKGLEVPPEVIERIKTIAAANALADIALELSSNDWRVRTLIHPGADFARAQASVQHAAPIQDPGRQARHAMLDALLDSGQPDAIMAIEHLLKYFAATLPRAAEDPPATEKPPRQQHAKSVGQRSKP